MANKKQPTKKATKKAVSAATKAKREASKRRDASNDKQEKRTKKPLRSLGCKITPYVLICFSLILAVCMVIVRLLDMDDGAGAIGYWLQGFFGGLFGGAAIFLPLILGYIGIKWCVHNVKWKERDMVPSSQFYDEYRKAKRRMILQLVMAVLVFLTISTMMGVLADYSDLDLLGMWEDGFETLFEGGGVIGGVLGYGLTLAFQQVVSMILLGILLFLFVILALGLTPDFFVSKIREHHESHREERAYLAAERKEQEAARREEAKRAKEEERKAREEERLAREQEKREEEAARRAWEEERATAAAAAAAATVYRRENDASAKPELSHEEMMDMVEPSDADLPFEEIPEAEPVEMTEEPKEIDPIEEMTANLGKDYGDSAVSSAAPNPEEYDTLDQFFETLNHKEPTQEAEAPKAPAPTRKKAEPTPLELSELNAEELLLDVSEVTPEHSEEAEPEHEEPARPYLFPPMDLLVKNQNEEKEDYTAELRENAQLLLETLKSFRINIKSIDYSRGPTITRYELRPEAGVRVRSIANLVDDIALSLATSGVRIEAPIPGKPAVGIEVPNRKRTTVFLRDLVDNAQFAESKSKLTASLGMDVGGNPIYFDITKMPHMIIAGATGMGKSVCINGIIISILYKARPEDVKLILIDPKKVEFNLYKDIPHLYAPIVSEPKKAAGALASAVAEMERRFELIEEVGVRDITSYNAATENDPYKEHMPHMVIIIDELADLMMTAPDDVEASICRLAQKARAAGIHIIIGTQRPSVDVITGLIKANIPSRIACTVASQVDSRTIIDMAGAEKLIGRGDMLFAPVGAQKPLRVQGAFVTENEVESICTFIRENNQKAKYNKEFINRIEEEAARCGTKKGGAADGGTVSAPDGEGGDSKFHDAVKLAVEEGKISTSLMQRRLGVGYGRAAKIIDTMEQMGYVSKPDGNKPRRVLLTAEEYAQRMADGTLGGEE